jgi:outer membrane biosynthesis protein TonB
MKSLAVAPAPAERFSLGVAASTVLHAALFTTVLFGGTLFQSKNANWGSPDANGGSIRVKLAGSAGLLLPNRKPVNSNKAPSATPGDRLKEKAPTPVPPAATKPTKAPPAKKAAPAAKAAPPAPAPNAIPLPGTRSFAASQPPETGPAAVPPIASAAPAIAPAAPAANAIPGGASGMLGDGGAPNIQRGSLSNGNGATDAEFGDPSFGKNFPDYVKRLKQAITPYFDPPAGTRGRTLTIRLTIARDGTGSGMDFGRKSGIDMLDGAARRAVIRAMQERVIPPLPTDYRGASIQAVLLFESER